MADITNQDQKAPEQKQLTIEEAQERIAFLETESKKAFTSRDKIKEELRSLNTSLEESKKQNEDKLKKAGEYEQLISSVKDRESKLNSQQESLKKQLITNTLQTIGIQNDILKPEYVHLFQHNIELDDDFSIKNIDKVKESFVKFKEDNPTLFKQVEKTQEQKKIPATDKKLQIAQDLKDIKLTAFDQIKLALQNK